MERLSKENGKECMCCQKVEACKESLSSDDVVSCEGIRQNSTMYYFAPRFFADNINKEIQKQCMKTQRVKVFDLLLYAVMKGFYSFSH